MESQQSITNLNNEDRSRIHAEEILRDEIRASLRERESTTWQSRVWKLLNSSFAIFLLSSVVLGAISWQYQRWVSNQNKQAERVQLREEASMELGYRFFIMREVLKDPTATGRDGVYVRAVFFGQEPYAPAEARFKAVSVPALMFVLQREKLDDPFEKIIAEAMPEMSVAVQRLADSKGEKPLDKKTREELLDAVTKMKLLSIRW